jgi:hypothetical protein
MDHVGIVVDDLAAATEFFVELGLEPQGEARCCCERLAPKGEPVICRYKRSSQALDPPLRASFWSLRQPHSM